MTLVFTLATALLAWCCTRRLQRNGAGAIRLPLAALLAASLSHPLLDLLVGAHSLPLLWPLVQPEVALPFGLLPSAGRLALGNFYLWRNLLIEQAILLPVFALLVQLARQRHLHFLRGMRLKVTALIPVWLAFVLWSIALQR